MMNVKIVYKLTGYLSVVFGIIAALSIYRMNYLYYGIGISILGFISAIINIFLNTRYYSEQEKYPNGYIGVFLSSLPVLFLMFIIFKFRK
jgi:bacteriorhodopsin